MANKIQISSNKVLKLTNVLIGEIDIREENEFLLLVTQMDNFIKSKGAIPVGPLIQKTSYSVDEEGQLDVHIYLMRQSNNFIHNVEAPIKWNRLFVCAIVCMHVISDLKKKSNLHMIKLM